jgi:nucleoside-diphosphate-sugar epimerase
MTNSGKVFVTGANGFIGTRLVEALVARGRTVRALSRRPNLQPDPPPGFGWAGGGPLASPEVQWVRGDITDRDSLVQGMEGCDEVYHLAAYAKNWSPDPGTFFDMNVQGMRNVFDAAAQRGVRRVVWTSTMVTFGPTPPGEVFDENSPRITDQFLTEYEQTKTVAEHEALRRAKDGFPVVIVNPSRLYGPGHLTEGNSVSRLIDDYDRGRVPVLLNFGRNVGNWAYIDDVVQGHILAMEKGRIGERYLLGGENASLKEFFRLVDRVSGKRHFQVPLLRITPLVFAWILKKRAQWFGAYPQITPGWVRTFLAEWAFSTKKAENELDYRVTPLAEGLRRTYEWLQRVRKERS